MKKCLFVCLLILNFLALGNCAEKNEIHSIFATPNNINLNKNYLSFSSYIKNKEAANYTNWERLNIDYHDYIYFFENANEMELSEKFIRMYNFHQIFLSFSSLKDKLISLDEKISQIYLLFRNFIDDYDKRENIFLITKVRLINEFLKKYQSSKESVDPENMSFFYEIIIGEYRLKKFNDIKIQSQKLLNLTEDDDELFYSDTQKIINNIPQLNFVPGYAKPIREKIQEEYRDFEALKITD